MAIDIKGNWLSWINRIPVRPPNEGFVTINEPDGEGHFDGWHHHFNGDFRIHGQYTPATRGTLDHFWFEGTQEETNCKFRYEADIIIFVTDHMTINGKRHRECGEDIGNDDWVGTHTT